MTTNERADVIAAVQSATKARPLGATIHEVLAAIASRRPGACGATVRPALEAAAREGYLGRVGTGSLERWTVTARGRDLLAFASAFA